MTSTHTPTIEPTEFKIGPRPVRGLYTASCPECDLSSGPWTENEAKAWQEGHSAVVVIAPVRQEQT